MPLRLDFTEFSDEQRVQLWRELVPDDADLSILIVEALGHAVGLRDFLAETGSAPGTSRAVFLVEVLNRLRDTHAEGSGPPPPRRGG